MYLKLHSSHFSSKGFFKLHYPFQSYSDSARLDKWAGSPRQNILSWQTSILCIVVQLAGGGSLAVAVCVAVATVVVVAVDFISFDTCQKIQ